jgi:serine/threonine-protein kinase
MQHPTRVGRYEIEKPIGGGATGMVYRARDPADGKAVAIKIAHSKPEDSERTIQRRKNLFANEGRASALLDHDNIVKVFEVGDDDGRAFIAMELIEGSQTLDGFCTPEELLPIEQVVEIAIRCAVALDYAHRNGVVHRDIKPRNILLTADKQVKISDFGIALVTGVDAADTHDRGQPGSPLYMSPEQVSGETATPQSDIFSLGVVMYELLSGKHPFIAELIPAIGHNITHKAHVPLRQIRPEVPPALEKIVDRALKKHPAGRYQTGLDLAGDLGLVFDHIKLEEQDASSREEFERVKDLSFFASFPESEIWEVLNASHWQEFKPGDPIITEGEFGDSFHILVDGEVIVRKAGTAVDLLRKGACFGEIGFVTRKKRMASIIAKTPVVVMEIRAALIERISIGCQLRFHKAFIDTMAERLLRAMELNSRQLRQKRQG